MNIGKTYEKIDINLDLKNRQNSNNLLLCLGDSGKGKTTFLKHLAIGANNDGIPVIIPDISESYCWEEMKKINNVEYFNIFKAGIPIDIFEPRTFLCDGEETVENAAMVGGRIAGALIQAFNIRGINQTSVLVSAVKNYVKKAKCEKSFMGILKELKGMVEPQAKTLEYKLRLIADVTISQERIDWNDIVERKSITVLQLSFFEQPLRNLLLELIMADFWEWAKKCNNRKDVFLVLDEVENFSFKSPYFMSHMREFRKFGIGGAIATQFIGGMVGKEAENLLRQASMRAYFGVKELREVNKMAKDIDFENFKEWIGVVKELDIGSCVFCGKISCGIVAPEQKIVLKIPYEN